MLVVIPRIILWTNVLNYLFPGTSSGGWFGATFQTCLLPQATQVCVPHRYTLPWEPGWAAAVSDGTPQDGQLSGLDSPPGPFWVSLRVQRHLLLNISIWASSHTVEFDLALVRISPSFQSADRQPQLTKSLVPYSTNLANKTGGTI